MVNGATVTRCAFFAGICIVLLSSAVAARPAVAAVETEEHGYWWRSQTGVGPALPAPKFVPSGGLWVARDPAGDQAVSALRFRLAAGDRAETLTLDLGDTVGAPDVVACPAAGTGVWAKAEAGGWDGRPRGDCQAGSVAPTVAAGGRRWTFSITAFQRDGIIDVVLLPRPGSSGSFSVTFPPPTAASLALAAPPGAAPAETAPTDPVPPPAPTSPAADQPAPAVSPPAPVGGAINSPFAPAFTDAAPLAPAVVEQAAEEVAVPTGAPLEAPAADAARNAASGSRHPMVLLVVVALIAVWVARIRGALTSATRHPLASPLAMKSSPAAWTGAEALLTASDNAT